MTLIPHDALDWLMGMLREGQAYYRHAATHACDPEIAHAFALAAQARELVLADLKHVGAIPDTTSSADIAAALATAPPQHRYDVLQQQFDPVHPQLQAQALVAREHASLRLIESVFRSNPSLAVRRVMKAHYPRIAEVLHVMQRLAQRDRAA